MDGAAWKLLSEVSLSLCSRPLRDHRSMTVLRQSGETVDRLEVAANLVTSEWTITDSNNHPQRSGDNSSVVPLEAGLLLPMTLPIWGRREDDYSPLLVEQEDDDVVIISRHRESPDVLMVVRIDTKRRIAIALTSPYLTLRQQP